MKVMLNTIKTNTKLIIKTVYVVYSLLFSASSAKNSKESIILFLGVDAGLRPHFMAICILARVLKLAGYKPVVLRCYKSFKRCPIIEGHIGIALNKKNVHRLCIDCASNSIDWLKKYEIDSIDIRDYIQNYHDKESLEQQILKLGVDFQYNGIPFGKICAADILRNYKISSIDYLKEKMNIILNEYIKDAVLNYRVFEIISKMNKIKSVVYFGDYNIYFGIALKCMRDNIDISLLHQPALFHVSRDKVIIEKEIWGLGAQKMHCHFLKWQTIPLLKKEVQAIAEDVIYKLENKEKLVYSPAKNHKNDIFITLNLPRDKKILVAYTSSLDEIDALICQYESIGIDLIKREQLFKDQITWIEDMIDFVSKNNDYYLIVRIHPREGNQRDGKTSEHFYRLKEKFSEIPKNIAQFIWPHDLISSYDIAEIADVVLYSWSSIGSELSRLGVPVVSAFDIHWVQPNHICKSKTEYFDRIKNYTTMNADLYNIKQTFRWYHIRILANAIEIDDLVKNKHSFELPNKFSTQIRNADVIEKVMCMGKEVIDLKYENRKHTTDEQEVSETQEILNYIKKVIYFLLYGKTYNSTKSIILNVLDSLPESNIDTKEVLNVGLKYPHISCLDTDGKKYIKYSPMIARLCYLYKNYYSEEMNK